MARRGEDARNCKCRRVWAHGLDLDQYLNTAHRAALAVQAGYVWINEVSKHFLGAPFGGFKQSGLGREECFEEMLSFTQEKNIHIRLKPAKNLGAGWIEARVLPDAAILRGGHEFHKGRRSVPRGAVGGGRRAIERVQVYCRW